MSPPLLTADLVVLTVRDSDLKVWLTRRSEPPFEGGLALPGVAVRLGGSAEDLGEDLEDAARRALFGLAPRAGCLMQVGAFGAPRRDPRGRAIGVAWLALVPAFTAFTDVSRATWVSCRELPPLAFDHGQMIAAAIARLRQQLEPEGLAAALLPETFTVAELREVHEAVHGASHDPANFRRRFKRLLEEGAVTLAPGRRQTRSKPAAVYRFRVEDPR